MNLLVYYFSLFIIYGFLGWIVDTFFHSLHSGKLKKGGTFFYGPISLIYGIPLIIVAYTLNNYNINEYVLILIVAILVTIWEYIGGVILEKLFHKKFWDYSKKKFNYDGKICLEMSLIWGILIFVFVKFLYSFINEIIYNIPNTVLEVLLIISYLMLIIDIILSTIKNKNSN